MWEKKVHEFDATLRFRKYYINDECARCPPRVEPSLYEWLRGPSPMAGDDGPRPNFATHVHIHDEILRSPRRYHKVQLVLS